MRSFRPLTTLTLAALVPLLAGCDTSKKVQKIGGLLEKLTGDSKPSVSVPAGHYSPPQDISESEFKGFINQPGRLSVVVFHAEWCGPCKQLKPIIEDVAPGFADTAAVARVDVDKAQSVAMEYGVRSIPDVRFFRDGKQVDKFVGLPSAEEVRSRFETNTAGIQVAPAGSSPAGTMEPMKKDWRPPGIEKRGASTH